MRIDVKQEPGFHYPEPVNHVRIVERANEANGVPCKPGAGPCPTDANGSPCPPTAAPSNSAPATAAAPGSGVYN